jgi:hypothetical protein
MKISDSIIFNIFGKRDNFFWDLGKYRVPYVYPKKYLASFGEYGGNNKDHREKLLKNNKELPNCIKFKEFLENKFKDLEYIEEFPVPIVSSVWEDFYKELGGLDGKEINKKWFSLDFYFPEYNTAIQLDSIMGHSGNLSIRDIAEDRYLASRHGIKTIRSSKLQFKNLEQEEFNRLEKEIESLKKSLFTFDYNETFCKIFREEFKQELEFIESNLIKYMFVNNITGENLENKRIILDEKEIPEWFKDSIYSPFINSRIPGGITKISKRSRVSYILKELFGYSLFIKP